MINYKFICLKDCRIYPDSYKGKEYIGAYDENGDLWIFDEWWLDESRNVKIEDFNVNIHGTFVVNKNLKYFEIIKA